MEKCIIKYYSILYSKTSKQSGISGTILPKAKNFWIWLYTTCFYWIFPLGILTPFPLVKNFVWLDKTSSLWFSPHFDRRDVVPASWKNSMFDQKELFWYQQYIIKKHNKSQTSIGINRFMIKSTFTFFLL